MNDLKNKIIGLTLGIRYNRSFRIPDVSGEIIDNVLYSEKTPFGNSYFPRVQENSSREKTLFNSNTSEYLRINTDDIILGISIENNFEERFEWLKNEVLTYFKDQLFRTYEIKNISRLGIVFSHKIEKNKKLADSVALLTENEVLDADNISMSFSKKAPVAEALFRKEVNDYKNRIYNIQEVKEAVYADLDYQYYYEPAIEDLRECFSDKILDDAKHFLESNFYIWLNKYESKGDK